MRSLIDFARTHGANTTIVQTLIAQLRSSYSPSVTSNITNKHYHQQYQVNKDNRNIIKMMHMIFEHQFRSKQSKRFTPPTRLLSLRAKLVSKDRQVFDKLISRWSGLNTSQRTNFLSLSPKLAECLRVFEQAQCEQFLVKQALMFAYYGIGNCSHRAALSGILLVHAFKDTGVNVRIVVNTQRDQYMVWLIKDDQTFVFDAITDFESIFDKTYYDEHILLPCFSEVPTFRRSKLEVNICPSLSLWKTLRQELSKHKTLNLRFNPTSTLNNQNTLLSLLPVTPFGIDLQMLNQLASIKKNSLSQ